MLLNNLINIIIILVLLFITPRIVNKIAKTKGKRLFASMGVFLALVFITSPVVTTIENYLFNFKTPESVFNFMHSEEIVDIVYGNESCMIIYSKSKNQYAQEYIPKSENSYKIPYDFSTKNVYNSFISYGHLSVDKVSGTNDNYVIGMIVIDEEPRTVVNSENKEIKYIIDDMTGTESKNIIFYDVVSDFTDDYYIKINDKIVRAK